MKVLSMIVVSTLVLAGAMPGGRAAGATSYPCSNAGTQSDMNVCAFARYQAADKRLNKTYQRVMLRLHDNSAKAAQLVKSEQAWIAFRDAECRFLPGADGGTMQPMLIAQCQERMTNLRTGDLTRLLHCAEDDMECPVTRA